MANPNPKTDHLTHKLTVKEQSMGGKASVESRRRKKSLREKAELLMSLSIRDKDDIEKLNELGIDSDSMDNEMMSLVHMLNIIKKENFNSVSAFNSLKELTTGESDDKETPSVQINIVDNSNLEKVLYSEDNN